MKTLSRALVPRLRAFTLTELLIVVAILATLAAILLPVFARVRANSRETVCLSNLRQLGQAMLMYTHDSDDRFPYGGDPADLFSGLSHIPGRQSVVSLQPLPIVMASYVGDNRVWSCPADTGFVLTGFDEGIPFDTRPSSYNRFGSSYYYYTELMVGQYPVTNLMATSEAAPYAPRYTSDIVLLADGSGLWHGGPSAESERYTSLFVDGHAKSLTKDDYQAAYAIKLAH